MKKERWIPMECLVSLEYQATQLVLTAETTRVVIVKLEEEGSS